MKMYRSSRQLAYMDVVVSTSWWVRLLRLCYFGDSLGTAGLRLLFGAGLLFSFISCGVVVLCSGEGRLVCWGGVRAGV